MEYPFRTIWTNGRLEYFYQCVFDNGPILWSGIRKCTRVMFSFDEILDRVSPTSPSAQISLVRGEPIGKSDFITLSIEVADFDSLHAVTVKQGIKIVYPLTDEP